jgi:3-mercaptopyruvate sulfurtransferase SseA
MTSKTLAETETAIYQSAANRTEWHLVTEDPVMIRKMERLGIKPVKVLEGGWHEYTLQGNQVSFRKGVRAERTEAQKERDRELAERMRLSARNKAQA